MLPGSTYEKFIKQQHPITMTYTCIDILQNSQDVLVSDKQYLASFIHSESIY